MCCLHSEFPIITNAALQPFMHTRSVTFARPADAHERMPDSNTGSFSPLSDGHFVVVWWNIGNGDPEILLA